MSRTTEPRSRRAWWRALAVLIVAVLLGGLGVAPAQAAPGDITGRLVDQYGNPVLGLDFTFYNTSGDPYPVSSDGVTGEFLVNVPSDGYYYYNVDDEFDDLGYGYVQKSEGDHVVGTYHWGDIVLQRYENIAGTITNWDAAMIGVDVSVSYRADASSSWSSTGYQVTTTTGLFSVPAILDDGEYAVLFQLDPSSRAPYLDAFLGGELDDPADSDIIDATAGSPEIVAMTMPEAALIHGTVTTDDGATVLEGIYIVGLQDSGAGLHADITQSDVHGEYTLRARPGETYIVAAFDGSGDSDPYASMIYDGFYGCTCQFTPVIATVAAAATGIDFDMSRESELFFILGELYDTSIDTGDPLDDVSVHVQRKVSGTWTDVAITESDGDGWFEVVVPADDIAYRLVFEDAGTVLRIVEGEVGPGSASSSDPAPAGCFHDTGLAESSWLDDGVLYYVVLGLNPSGGCTTTPPPSGTPGAQPGPGFFFAPPATDEVAPTPTPTPTPTPSASPSPSSSPTPDASAPAEPTATSAPDLWWLLWLGIVVLVVVLVGGAVIVVRRT